MLSAKAYNDIYLCGGIHYGNCVVMHTTKDKRRGIRTVAHTLQYFRHGILQSGFPLAATFHKGVQQGCRHGA